MTTRVKRAEVTMRMIDGDLLTPQQMQRIVNAVIAELRRSEDDEHSRRQDTRVTFRRYNRRGTVASRNIKRC